MKRKLLIALVCALALSLTLADVAITYAEPLTNVHTITLTANPSEGGTVTGAGTYSDGETVTVSASANEGYRFDHWVSGTGSIGDAVFSFVIHENRTYEAVFVEDNTHVSSYTLVMPESITVTPNAETTAFTVNVPALDLQPNASGNTPESFRVKINAATLVNQSDAEKTISFKLCPYDETVGTSDTLYFRFDRAQAKNGYIVITGSQWNTATPGVYTGSMTYQPYYQYSNGDPEWLETIHSIPITLTIPSTTPTYTVTLDPGVGQGEPITYNSAKNGISTESWNTVGNCQFYYEDDGSLAFRLMDDVCPSTFSPAADALPGTVFDGWQGNDQYNKLSSPQTTFTAKWKQNWDLVPDASYSLSVDKSQLSGPGFTDLTITADELVLGKFDNGKDDSHDYKMAESLCLFFKVFNLTDSSGNTLRAQKYYGDHTYSSWGVMMDFTAQGQENALAIYIDPQDYATAAPGVYTGEMEAYVNWNSYSLGSDIMFTFPLTLTVAHTPQDSYTIIATADPTEGGTVTGTGDYAPGETVTLAPVPSEGYVFRRWRVDGIDRTYSTAYSFPALVDREVTAVFLPAAPLAPGDNALSLPGDSYSYFVFIPMVSGEHTFLLTGDTHAGAELYQGSDYLTEGYSLAEDDIEFTYALTAGIPYTLIVSTWDDETQEIVVHVGVPEPEKYAITTDGAAQAYYYNDSFEQVFPTEAAKGTALSLTLDDSAVPETGYYFTGEFTLNGVSLGHETSEDGLTSWPVTGFTMPDEAVTIGAVQAERETLALSFALDETRALPMDAWMQLQYYETAEGEPPLIWYDETTGTEALDVNRDGKPDLQIAFDDSANCVNLIRMPACVAVGEFAFAFSGPTDRYGTIAFTIPAPAFSIPDFTLPAALTTVEAEAFEGIAASVVDVPANCTSIGDHAFSSCPNLTQIRVPANCELGEDVFDGCTMVYVFGTAGSPAESYCKTHANCEFVPIE